MSSVIKNAVKVKKPFSCLRKAGIVGDSIDFDDGYSTFGLMNSLFTIEKTQAQGGFTVLDALNAFDFSDVVVDVISVKLGTNDATAGLDYTVLMSNYDLLIKSIESIGAIPLIVLPPPRVASGVEEINKIRDLQRCYAIKNNLYFFDPFDFTIDKETGLQITSYYKDGVHPAGLTQIEAGGRFGESLKEIFIKNTSLVTANAQGAGLFNNPLLYNNTDGKAVGFGTTYSTSVPSIVTDPEFTGKVQKITFTNSTVVSVPITLGDCEPDTEYIVTCKIRIDNVLVENDGFNIVIADDGSSANWARPVQPRVIYTDLTSRLFTVYYKYKTNVDATELKLIYTQLAPTSLANNNVEVLFGEIQAYKVG